MRDPLFKRGNIWWCWVRDARGVIGRQSTRCRDYQSAVLAYKELERQGADPAYGKAASTRLDSCIEDYFDELERRKVSPATLKKEATKAGHYLRLWHGDLPMSAVVSQRVYDYIKTREGEGVSPHTVKMELQTLQRILKVAIHHGLFHLPIEQVMPIKYGSKHKPKKRAPSMAEVQQLLEQFPSFRAAHLAYFVATGARLSEATRARRKHYDPKREIVFLEGRKTEKSEGEVPVTILTKPLIEWSLERAPGKDILFRPWGKLHRDVAAGCVRAGIENVTPNDLRRSFGSWHAEAGVTIKDVSLMLRHSTDKLAQTTYARLDGEQVGRLVAAKLTVSILDRTAAQTEINHPLPPHDLSEKQAPPAEVESATNALGKRTLNARSIGNYRAWQRRKADKCVDSDRHPPPWVHEASSNLLALLAGVAP